jgi:heterotetrameric sarcosine oxidase delta subunit
MMLLPCPWCGHRNVSEFRYVGAIVPRPDPASVTLEQWRTYLYFRANRRGWQHETWYHRAGCHQYIAMERNTATNEVRPQEPAGEQPSDLEATAVSGR